MASSVAGLMTVTTQAPDGLAERRGPDGVDQRLEQGAIAACLGVPLHTEDEAMTGQLHRFDHTVLAPGGNRQSASYPVEGLMVTAHHLGPLTEQTPHHGPGLGSDHDRSVAARVGAGGRPTPAGREDAGRGLRPGGH